MYCLLINWTILFLLLGWFLLGLLFFLLDWYFNLIDFLTKKLRGGHILLFKNITEVLPSPLKWFFNWKQSHFLKTQNENLWLLYFTLTSPWGKVWPRSTLNQKTLTYSLILKCYRSRMWKRMNWTTVWNRSFWQKPPNTCFYFLTKTILFTSRTTATKARSHRVKIATQQVLVSYLIRKHIHWIWGPYTVVSINIQIKTHSISLEESWKLKMAVRGDPTIRITMGLVIM